MIFLQTMVVINARFHLRNKTRIWWPSSRTPIYTSLKHQLWIWNLLWVAIKSTITQMSKLPKDTWQVTISFSYKKTPFSAPLMYFTMGPWRVQWTERRCSATSMMTPITVGPSLAQMTPSPWLIRFISKKILKEMGGCSAFLQTETTFAFLQLTCKNTHEDCCKGQQCHLSNLNIRTNHNLYW